MRSSQQTEKSPDKIQHSLTVKIFNKLAVGGEFPQLDKGHL